jgi:hypothetical protein
VPLAGGGIEALETLPYRGGSGDRRGGASPPSTPTDRRTRLHSSLSLTLGPGTISLVAARRSRRDRSSRRALQEKISSISVDDAPQG